MPGHQIARRACRSRATPCRCRSRSAARRAWRRAAPACERAVPVVARLMRIDGRGVEQLARAVNDRDLHAGADARDRAPSSTRCPAGAASSRSCRLRPKRGSLRLRPVRAAAARLRSRGAPSSLIFHVHRTVSASHHPPARPFCSMPARAAMRRSGSVGPAALSSPAARPPGAGSLVAAAQQREHAMRRDALQRLAGVEVVGELGALPPPCPASPWIVHSPRSQSELPQSAEELGVFREVFHQDPARALERRRRIGDALRRR